MYVVISILYVTESEKYYQLTKHCQSICKMHSQLNKEVVYHLPAFVTASNGYRHTYLSIDQYDC